MDKNQDNENWLSIIVPLLLIAFGLYWWFNTKPISVSKDLESIAKEMNSNNKKP